MPDQVVSRRTFLIAAGVSTAAVLGACTMTANPTGFIAPTPTPHRSPFLRGPFQTKRVILGENGAPPGLPQPFQASGLRISPSQFSQLPRNVPAAVYFPSDGGVHTFTVPNPLSMPKGPFPVLLYAHAFRSLLFSTVGTHPANRDFTSVDAMLSHVASYGCIAVAPDLSWLSDDLWGHSTEDTFNERAIVLVQYFAFLSSLNSTLFAQQLDTSRVVLVGHSTGAGGATHAGRIISGFSHPESLSYGLIAPEFGGDSGPDVHSLLVLGGTLDLDQDADPQGAYISGGKPKTWVTIPGANHFGYTDICPNNACANILLDENGTISLDAQQQTGAAYLAALVRYYALGDATARAYLTGELQVEGLETLGVTGIQVQSAGLTPLPTGPTVGPNLPPTPTVTPSRPTPGTNS